MDENYGGGFDLISADIEKSYIRQNLPIRRQSLIVYHDQLHASNEPKRHSSMLVATGTAAAAVDTEKPLSIKLANNFVEPLPAPSPEKAATTTATAATTVTTAPPPTTKIIGILSPSRSESTRKELWNDIQPLSKLKSVFSRLHPNETLTTSKRSYCSHDVKKKKKKSTGKNHHAGIIYTALLSHVSKDFLKKIQLSTIGEYHDVFDGTTAVNCILDILNTNDRNLALLVGRALENQDLFHHVDYKYKLRDSDTELYQFQFIHHDDTIFLETMSANKLSSKKSSNKRNVPSACKTLPINGIFSVLTDCYSPTCTRKSPCYSISCPRMKEKKSLQRPLSLYFGAEQERSLWRHSVPLNVVLGANNLEQKRQECIYELIYTEEDFTKDMHYVQDFWIEPIRWGDIIPIERRNDFITDVFWNIKDIERVSSALSKDLTSRQDKHTIIPRIGDILLSHVKDFQPFVIYGAHQIIGKHEYELEKKRNVKLQQFAEKLERQPESRRLELNGYLTKPTLRLGRYNLLLNTIHQLTPANHQDYQDLPKVIRTITEFMILLNKKVGLSDNAFHLEQIASKILPTKGLVNLDLLDPKRQLIMRGKMKRFNDQTWDIQVFLFDHYLVICKIKYQDGLEYYKVYGKPIPFEALHVSIPNSDMIPSPVSAKSNIYNKITSPPVTGFPIVFHYLDESITLFTENESTRKL
ncbi:hypothetical protein INT47_001090, partial [Mucor saturninus]